MEGLTPEQILQRFVIIPVEKIVKADWNYKGENPELTAKLVENIKRNGQIENTIVRELETGFYEMVNGNHRYDAIKAAGLSSIVCYNAGPISQAQAIRMAIETNETRFATDTVKLAERIAELSVEFELNDLASTTAFSEDQLVSMKKMLDFNWDEFADDGSGSGDGDNAPKDSDKLSIKVSPETKERWSTLVELYHKHVEEGNDNDVLDFAVGRALFELEQNYGKK